MRFGKFIVLLLAVLLLQQAQCLAACAVDACTQTLPPCHRHHDEQSKTSTLCPHDAVVSPAVQVCVADLPPTLIPSCSVSLLVSEVDAPLALTASPPGPSITILRI
jgi:hypothetical protein